MVCCRLVLHESMLKATEKLGRYRKVGRLMCPVPIIHTPLRAHILIATRPYMAIVQIEHTTARQDGDMSGTMRDMGWGSDGIFRVGVPLFYTNEGSINWGVQ